MTIEVANETECRYGGIVVISGQIRQPVCNGAPGATGQPGHSPVVTTLPATPAECQYGGVQILVDGEEIGYVCNGAPGKDGVCDCDKDECPLTCKDGYGKYNNTCYKICKDEPAPHEVVCPVDWLSKTQSCSKPQDNFLTCWPISVPN